MRPRTVALIGVLFVAGAASYWAHVLDERGKNALVMNARAPQDAKAEQLIGRIHSRLLDLRIQHTWLSGYRRNCLTQGRIFYMPPMPANATLASMPQMPDQLVIHCIPINAKRHFKYLNELEDIPQCRFQTLGLKIYADILVRGDEKTKAAIRECIIDECTVLQQEIAQPDAPENVPKAAH